MSETDSIARRQCRVQTERRLWLFPLSISILLQGVPKMDQIIPFLKAHKYEIKKYGKKVRRRGRGAEGPEQWRRAALTGCIHPPPPRRVRAGLPLVEEE